MRLRHMAAAMILCLASPRPAAPAGGDEYLRGYIDSWIAINAAAAAGRMTVRVEGGVVTLTGSAESPEEIDRIVTAIGSLEGVVRVVNRLALEAGDVSGRRRWRTWIEWLRPPPGRRTVRFPAGDLFAGPLADQKQPRFHTTWQSWHTSAGRFDIASVGFGENFGLVRWPRGSEGDGWQVGISGAVFAVFNLDSRSIDLLNADYYAGFPISYRSGAWSGRLRLLHQSSHLGDEFLLQLQDPQPVPQAERINLSFEAAELLGSYDKDGARLYFGGMRIVTSEPRGLGRQRFQAGAEFRGNPVHWRTSRIVAGLDVQSWNETGWERDLSVKVGLMFRSPYGDARSLQALLEYYNGHAPHGQFFTVEVEYFGIGVAYAF